MPLVLRSRPARWADRRRFRGPRARDGPESIRDEELARSAQRRIGVKDRAGDALEQLRLVAHRSRALASSARARSAAARSMRSKEAASRYLPAAASASSAARRDARSRTSTRAVAPGGMRTRRRSATTGSSTVPAVSDSGRASTMESALRKSRPRPRNRARSVSNCSAPSASPSTTLDVKHPERRSPGSRLRRVASSVPPPSAIEFGLHEHLRERRVRGVGGRRRQHHLGVARQLDLAGAPALVGDRHAAHLRVVVRRDQDVRRR